MYGGGTRIAVYMDINTADYKHLKCNTIENKDRFLYPALPILLLVDISRRRESFHKTYSYS